MQSVCVNFNAWGQNPGLNLIARKSEATVWCLKAHEV